MVNAVLSGRAGALGEDGKALVADLGEAAGHRNALRLAALASIDGDVAVLERRHIGRMPGHDTGFTLGPGDHDHVDVARRDQPVRSNKLEMQIGHHPLPLIFASNARVAASNLSRQPVLQNPTTLPRYSVRLSALTGLPDQGQVSLTQSL